MTHAQNRIRAMYELTHPKTAHDAEELKKMEKILEKYYNQEKEMLIRQNTLLQGTNEELQNFILKQHKNGNKTNNQIQKQGAHKVQTKVLKKHKQSK